MADSDNEAPQAPTREVPIDWESLENAFENNAPEVHSYLHLVTGDVLRVVDGIADPQMHARIAADPRYLRIEPVSSREQYRWMERFIPTVEEPKLRARLEVSIDGKGAFRRFKDVLMAHGPERERWFTYRSERLRTFMEAWLTTHSIQSVPREEWKSSSTPDGSTADEAQRLGPGSGESYEYRRGRNIEALRKRLHELADVLGPRDLDTIVAFADFLRARRTARSLSYHQQGSQMARRDVSESGPPEEMSAAPTDLLAEGQEITPDRKETDGDTDSAHEKA